MKELPSVDYLGTLLRYDRTTGQLFWRPRPVSEFVSIRAHRTWNTKYANKPAGHINLAHGYVEVRINRIAYYAHRIVWKLRRKEEPPILIDHKNGVRHDNRISNLRAATSAQNVSNAKLATNNTSGVKGVSFCRITGKWVAQLMHKGKQHYLGRFSSVRMATIAVSQARKQLHREFARHV